MFVVVPDQFVVFDAKKYGSNFDQLYLMENLIFLLVLALAVWTTHTHWRKLYLHLFWATVFYTLGSFWLNEAIDTGKYYSGSPFDIPYIVAVCWFAWIGVIGGTLPLANEDPSPKTKEWIQHSPRLAMLAVLSLPLFGAWVLVWDGSIPELKRFRLALVMIFMVLLGVCVFFKQHLLDRALLNMVEVERRNNDQLKRLQGRLVQKEKLASLGQLVAGAAHEINNPLTAILGYSELLSTDPTATASTQQMAQKIAQQARRTSHLVSDLQSFSQASASERALVDVASLLNRVLQMQILRMEGKGIRIEADLEPQLPRIWGSANGLFQVFAHIVENACDALEDNGGGSLYVRLRRTPTDLVLDFADTGKGIRDPQRVFDPFYTTKPVGQGTGLGLSAAYGIIQEHAGEISCSNRDEGGAVFTVRLPLASGQAQAAAGIPN
jgi:signal transduction histidine kinase